MRQQPHFLAGTLGGNNSDSFSHRKRREMTFLCQTEVLTTLMIHFWLVVPWSSMGWPRSRGLEQWLVVSWAVLPHFKSLYERVCIQLLLGLLKMCKYLEIIFSIKAPLPILGQHEKFYIYLIIYRRNLC